MKTMRLKVIRRVTAVDEIDVIFPVFYKSGDTFDEGGSYNTIYRINDNGKTWSITRRENRWGHVEYEFDADEINLENQIAQYLGGSDGGGNVSTEAEFIALVNDARSALAAFPA